jgi:hypothetical protein
MRKLALSMLLALVPASASANFSPPLTIVGIDIGDNNKLYLRFAEQTECGTYVVYIPQSAPYYDSALSVALSAYSTNKKISIWIETCQGADPAEARRVVLGTVFN